MREVKFGVCVCDASRESVFCIGASQRFPRMMSSADGSWCFPRTSSTDRPSLFPMFGFGSASPFLMSSAETSSSCLPVAELWLHDQRNCK
jgi:hypothetical protein